MRGRTLDVINNQKQPKRLPPLDVISNQKPPKRLPLHCFVEHLRYFSAVLTLRCSGVMASVEVNYQCSTRLASVQREEKNIRRFGKQHQVYLCLIYLFNVVTTH